MEFLIFVIAAAVAVAAALMMVLQRNAMYSALFLVVTFFCIALFYVLLGAFFLAVVQVAVYAGAIMVLMLFVLMLLNVAHPEPADRRLAFLRPFAVIAALVLVVELGVAVNRGGPAQAATGTTGTPPGSPATPIASRSATTSTITTTGSATGVSRTTTVTNSVSADRPATTITGAADTAAGGLEVGHTQRLAAELFTRFLFPFEVTSILLLAAILGAAVLARKRPEVM